MRMNGPGMIVGGILLGLIFIFGLATLIIVSVWSADQSPRLDTTGICNDYKPETLDLVIGSSTSKTRSCQNNLMIDGSECQSDICYVDGSCVVKNQKPVGVSTGECPGIFYSIYPVECPIPTFLSTVQTDILNTNLFYLRECDLGLCKTTIMYPGTDFDYIVGIPVAGSEFVDVMLTVPNAPDLEKKCMNQISDLDPSKRCQKAQVFTFFSSVFNDYLFFCEYTYSNAGFSTLQYYFGTDLNLLPVSVGVMSVKSATANITRNLQLSSKSRVGLASAINNNIIAVGRPKQKVKPPTEESVELEPEEIDIDTTFVPTVKADDDNVKSPAKEKNQILTKETLVPPKHKVAIKEISNTKQKKIVHPKFVMNKKSIHKGITPKKIIQASKEFLPSNKRAVEEVEGRDHGVRFDRMQQMFQKLSKSKKIKGADVNEKEPKISLHNFEVVMAIARGTYKTTEEEKEILLAGGETIDTIFSISSSNPLKLSSVILNGTSTPEFIIDSFFGGEEYITDFNSYLIEAAESGDLTSLDIMFSFASFYGTLNRGEFLGFMADYFLVWWWD